MWPWADALPLKIREIRRDGHEPPQPPDGPMEPEVRSCVTIVTYYTRRVFITSF